eukprot:2262215-Prymnesium_polylepis.1
MGERLRNKPMLQLRRGANHSTYVRSCRYVPVLRALAAQRRNATAPSRILRMVLLRRRNLSAWRGWRRQISSIGEVTAHLMAFAQQHRLSFEVVDPEALAPLAQVDHLLRTDVLISYHGS